MDEREGECGAFPYLISYQLKDGIDNVTLKDKPEADGKVISRVDNQHSLIKLKSINSQWLYVAEYDASKLDLLGDKKGYVEYRMLEPLN